MTRSASVSAFAFFTIVVTACSGGKVDVGATDANHEQLKKKADGGATGDGTTCSFDDVAWYDATTGKSGTSPGGGPRYNVGDTMPSPDGCNSCTCTAQGITCTMRDCAPVDGGGAGCDYNGHHYAAGEGGFSSADGCNTCSCESGGNVICTERACAYTCPPEKTIDCMPSVPPANQPKCSGPYHDWIVANCPGVVFAM